MSLRRKNSPAPTLAAGSSSSSVSSSNSSVPEASSADELARLIEYNDAVGVRRHLKKHAADVNAALDSRGRTPLMLAARTVRGDTNLMRVLLRCDRIVVNARDSGGNTALHHLVRSLTSGAIVAEVFELMAQHRADFAAVNAMHETILHVAVGNLAVPSLVVAVLERDCVDIGARTASSSLTALHYAIGVHNMYAIEQLIAWGAVVEGSARPGNVDMHALAATAVAAGAPDRMVPLLRVAASVQERLVFQKPMSLDAQYTHFFHTQRLPEPWTVVPASLSIMPDRDALLIEIVNSEIEHAYNVALLGSRYAPLLCVALGARELRSILTSLPDVHVVTRRLASALASGKYNPGEVFHRLLPDIAVAYEQVCASQQHSTGILRRACQRSKEFAAALAARAVDSRNVRSDSFSLFSMLNLPTLRLFKQKQQLQALLSWTPTTMPEHAALTSAISSFNDLFKRINATARRIGRIDLAHDLAERFGVPMAHDAELLGSGPVRLHDKRWRAAHAYVCTERLLLCDISSKKAKLVASYDIRACGVGEVLPDAGTLDRVPPARIFVLSCTHAGSVVRHHIAAHVDDSDPSQSKSDVRSRMHWVALLQRAIDDAQGRAARSRKGALSRTMSLHASPARDKALSPTISRPSSRSAAPAALAAPPLPAVPSTAGEPDDAGDADEGTTAMPNTVGSGATTEEIALLSANAHRIENACVLPEDAEPMPSTRASSSFAPAPVPMPDDYVIVNPLSLRQRAASNELSVDVRSGMRELASALNETSAYVPIAAKFDTYVSDVAAVSDDEQGDDDNDDGSDDSVVIHGDDVAVLVQSDGEVPPDVPEPPQFGSSDDVPPAMPASPPDTPPSPTEPPPPPPPQTHYDGVPDKATWHRNAKHACVACKRAVTGEVLKALGGVWHRGCFRCTHCRVHLSSSFVEFDSQPYCKADFMQLFAPRCAACNLPVAEQVVRAVGLSFHEECFACSVCNASLANKPYFEVNGRPACQLCGSAPPAKPKRKN